MIAKAEKLKIDVVIPVYNMEHTIGEAIKSVLNQTYHNFDIIVQDNDSTDKTADIVKSFSDPRIKYFKNETNIGYRNNLIAGWKNCQDDILYYLGADDILSVNALRETALAFEKDERVGAVTRPYFWFQESIEIPIRITPSLDAKGDEMVTIKDFPKAVIALHNEVLGQVSGLAFRLKYLEEPFFTKENEWIAHGYPFINIFKKYPIIFLKNCQVAVRIGHNTMREEKNDAYKLSPTMRWIDMLNEVFSEREHQDFKNYFIKKIIASNYIGLVQIRCYSRFRNLLREIWYLLRYRWQNIFDWKFWFFSLGCIFTPKSLLAKMVDWYKNKINSKIIKKIDFKYNIN